MDEIRWRRNGCCCIAPTTPTRRSSSPARFLPAQGNARARGGREAPPAVDEPGQAFWLNDANAGQRPLFARVSSMYGSRLVPNTHCTFLFRTCLARFASQRIEIKIEIETWFVLSLSE